MNVEKYDFKRRKKVIRLSSFTTPEFAKRMILRLNPDLKEK